MPEFILNRNKRLVPHVDAFELGYIEAMFFTNGDTGEDDDDHLNRLGVARLTGKARASIHDDCEGFKEKCLKKGIDLDCLDYVTAQRAGNDFWFTRQGHGVGFWDRSPETYGSEETRDDLDAIARTFGECYVEVWRGWIYVR